MSRNENRCLGTVDDGGVGKGLYLYLPLHLLPGIQSGSHTESTQPEEAASISLSNSDPKQWFLNIRCPIQVSLEKLVICANSRSQPQKIYSNRSRTGPKFMAILKQVISEPHFEKHSILGYFQEHTDLPEPNINILF